MRPLQNVTASRDQPFASLSRHRLIPEWPDSVSRTVESLPPGSRDSAQTPAKAASRSVLARRLWRPGIRRPADRRCRACSRSPRRCGAWETWAAATEDRQLTMAGLTPDLWAIGHSTERSAAVLQQGGVLVADRPETESLRPPDVPRQPPPRAGPLRARRSRWLAPAAVPVDPHRPGAWKPFRYQKAAAYQIRVMAVTRAPPATGSAQPGQRRCRTTMILATKAP